MGSRRGTSFVEVIVASVLLAVGVAGCLSTLAAAARMRHGASVREDLAARAHDRLGWFIARGCAVADTAQASPSDATTGLRDDWEHERDSLRARIAIQLSAPSSAMLHRIAIEAEVPCP